MAGLAASLLEGTLGPEALARAGVAEPATFTEGWSNGSGSLSERARRRIAPAVLASARPDAALHALVELGTPGPGGDGPLADLEAPGAESLARVLGGADFLARRASRLPDAVREVCSAASLPPRSENEARAQLRELETPLRLDRAGQALRRNRYAEMFRLTARALSGVPASETTRELSDLADASLAAGLRATEAVHDVAGLLSVVAMGKLGGRELNYSSDIDVLFAHGVPDADDACYQRLTRAVTSLRTLLSETTQDGFVFRVDLELRPEGRAGPLVNSADGLVDFYERFGRTWERVAWIRARPCAGDLALGERIVAELRPFVYRRYGSYEVVQNVRDVKQKIEVDARGADRNIKLGPGGIREAEFVVQGLQAFYGGRHETLRATNTAEVLSNLAELGILDADVASTLADDYDFLRRAENAIQMAEDRQTHEIPADADGLRRLARRLGRADPDGEAAARQLVHDLDSTRARVRGAFESLLTQREVRVAAQGPDADRWRQACGSPEAFAQEIVRAAAAPAVERARPAAERLARAVFAEGGDAAELADAPDAAPALGLFLATDPELVSHLIRRPALLRAFVPGDDASTPASEDLTPSDDLEAGLDALRSARRDASVRVAARRIRGEASEAELEAALSAAAERVLLGGLALAQHHDPSSRGRNPGHEPASLCILALGKLGSREMTFHSDLDLVFLY
ncbi:MAG: hypothetical protein JRH10_15305, partial [Deltaproteobacteria bacterium]|nr:hypothetical protein [Deltaproteobacteria bacterium]